MRVPSVVTLSGALALYACSSPSNANRSTGHAGGSGGSTSRATGGTSGSVGSTGSAAGASSSGGTTGEGGSVSTDGGLRGDGGSGGSIDGGPSSSCEPFGHYGAPGSTFTLPKSNGGGLYYPDVQASFPSVDWATLTRLYVPAGKYTEFDLGNLPTRDATHPLIITNHGGQVQVGPNPGANYIWSMDGGANWILTGRYDPDSGTGDPAFPGHRCGAYASSRGKYGFLSDDNFDLTAPYLHMGVAVASATDFEIEYVEIMRSGFAGLRLLNSRNAGDPPSDMANVKIHDDYIHDTNAEGTYFGWTGDPPANLLPGLQIYNNRIVRTGNEALQIQDLGDGTVVHNNVLAFASLHWRDNGLGQYQDNNAQIQTRSGTISIHDNVFIGGSGTVLSFWSQPETGDGDRHVTFDHNYFGDTKSLMAYLGGDAAATSDFHFTRNTFTGMTFTYDELDPTSMDPGVVFQISSTYAAPVEFTGNFWDGPNRLVNGLSGGTGTSGTITGASNENGAVTPIAFEDSGYPADRPIQSLEAWAPKATVNPSSPDITYAPGDLVMVGADLYSCTKTNTNASPPEHPESWSKLAMPVDDLRVKAGTSYQGIGVQ